MLTIVAQLDRRRFRPRLIVLSGEGPLSSLLPGDLPVTDLGKRRLRSALPGLRRTLRAQPADVICSTLAYLNIGVLALKPGLPAPSRVIVREANLALAGVGGLKRRLQRIGYRRLYPRASAVICPSTPVADSLTDIVPTVAERIEVVFNPVDEASLRAHALPIRREAGPGVRLVAAGRLTRQKGFDRLIELAPRLPPSAHITVLGDGPDRQSLQDLIRNRGLEERLTLAGYVDNPWAWFAGADAFLLPSRWEGLPNAALEALACGTPVISTPEAGGVRDIAADASESVTLAEMGAPFVGAVAAVVPHTAGDFLRPSLLPSAFALSTVVRRYEEILSGESPSIDGRPAVPLRTS